MVPLLEKSDTKDETLLKKWKWHLRSVKEENSDRHSQRFDAELKLTVARKLKDEEGFYYPCNLGFRGPVYPMHPYLNHLGSDLCGGILEFAEGQPLGKSGLHWLNMHLSNFYAVGVDKLSYDGQVAFIENHLEKIFDSADRPSEGKRWWLGVEDPFQYLVICMSLTEALRSSSLKQQSHIFVRTRCREAIGVFRVAAAMIGLSILILLGELNWEDYLNDKYTSDTLAWFANIWLHRTFVSAVKLSMSKPDAYSSNM